MSSPAPTAHRDTFARDHLPPPAQWPEFLWELPELAYPARINCAVELLDKQVAAGHGASPCVSGGGVAWTYAELLAQANRIAHVLVDDMGLVPGNRVLLRAANNPMMVACWFAVIKAGGIAVATMPLLRAKELCEIVAKAQISHALCDARLAQELQNALPDCVTLGEVRYFNEPEALAHHRSLEAVMATKPAVFDNVDTAADDTCLIAFTSGTTGQPKGTMHFHRDVLAICDCWPRSTLRARASDVFIGSPPLAFTFGLGGLVLFPMRVGASAVLLEKASPELLLAAIAETRATVCFTAPTSYRAMAAMVAAQGESLDIASLRKCVSAGEALPAATRQLWRERTGIALIDGIGATELLHIFISADEDNARDGATGKPIPGYVACVMDEQGRPVPPNTIGKLAVKGPTGCRYLDDERQSHYVKDGWNYTGDAYLVDGDGYFVYQSRTDDMIITAGYNVGAPEVEDALLKHADVAECAVIGVPDAERGQIVKAFVVPRAGVERTPQFVEALQNFVKQSIAPYKYPRAVELCDSLPRTESGKLQRFVLRAKG